ncbi:urease accessory protein UreF [Mycena sp. CBHHK59/15]|nr:urease accessory protein UreF [Mycena sp. CBHHK59/15]
MDETYLLLLLSDSNLPTGSFVASSGLESFLKHGFGAPPLDQPSTNLKMDTIATFIHDSLSTYAPSALPFVSDAHNIVQLQRGDADMARTLAVLKELDALYECMTLNHVAKRASKAQGVALLSLYSKGFSCPRACRLHAHGHLPVCWGVLCAALGLSLDRTQHLHLYLHARSLLSAAVRLNSIGPYAAQQILLHVVGTLVDTEVAKCAQLRTGTLIDGNTPEWDETQHGPANTWPLGEILAARHDLQHSRIFNS